METMKMRIHPLMAGAAVAVIIASALAVSAAPRQAIAADQRPPAAQAAPACPNCGVVASVRPYSQKPRTSKVGLIGGGVVGALVGNQIGDGSTLATAGGAVGGAYLGNKIGQKAQARTRYKVVVRMDDGRTRSFTYAARPGFRAGSHVRVENGTLVPFA